MMSPFLIEKSDRMICVISKNFFGQGVVLNERTGGE